MGGEDGRAEAAVEAGAEDGTGDVEARAYFALGSAVGCLGEVVQAAFALRGGEVDSLGEVVGEDCGGQGGDEGGGGADTGFVGFGDGDAEVVEAACGGGEV